MKQEWSELQRIANGDEVILERARLKTSGLRIEGEFALPPLATLPEEDQVFVAAFLKSHGSIKEMERLFGTSYPTIKNKLNTLSQKLGFLDVQPSPTKEDVLDRLERGEITADQAAEELKQ